MKATCWDSQKECAESGALQSEIKYDGKLGISDWPSSLVNFLLSDKIRVKHSHISLGYKCPILSQIKKPSLL